MTAKPLKTQTDTADGFLLVIAKDNSVKENIRAGIILENIWLNAADADIKIQPLSQILEEENDIQMPDFVKKLIAKKGRENVKMPFLVKKMLEKKYGKKYD